MNILSKHATRRRLIHGMPDSNVLAGMISRWFESPLGAAVLETERQIATPILDRLFGYHILQIGCTEDHSLIADSPIGHKIIFAPAYRKGIRFPVASIEELPLASDSIDVIVLHHALDFTEDSHKLLREATRVLRPGGQMLIIGFNPVSTWGIWRLFHRRVHIPWRGRFISRNRLEDWLNLLSLQVDHSDSAVHFLPVRIGRLLQNTQRWERLGQRLHSPLGGVYSFLCVKQEIPVTPIVPRWRPLRAHPAVLPAAKNVRARIH